MPDMSSHFSAFFKADDVRDEPRVLTIKDVAIQEIGPEEKRESKPVMTFVEDERGVTLNRTRYEAATEIFGDKNTDVWVGKKIKLAFDPNVKFAGKRVGGIVLCPTT